MGKLLLRPTLVLEWTLLPMPINGRRSIKTRNNASLFGVTTRLYVHFSRVVKVGCIPVVVSDFLEAYGPSLYLIVSFTEYLVLIDEQTFLKDPLNAILGIVERSISNMQAKLRALAFAKWVLLPGNDKSLFVPAVLYKAHLHGKPGLLLTNLPL
jgi:hypothetical protein